jgi:hypothetical protein
MVPKDSSSSISTFLEYFLSVSITSIKLLR